MKTARWKILVMSCLAMLGCSENPDAGSQLSGCNSKEDCATEFECVDGVCKLPVAMGDSCASQDSYCLEGVCTDGTCLPEIIGDESCDDAHPCPQGKVCTPTGCIKPVGVGGACAMDEGCLQGSCVKGVCTVVVLPGQTCNDARVCGDGYECHESLCMKPVEMGGDCRSSVSFCKDGECKQGVCAETSGASCQDSDGDTIGNEWDNCEDDTDGDGIVNCLDLDSDGDTIPDAIEARSEKCKKPFDSDMDGIFDFLDLDSDGNRIYDSKEGIRQVLKKPEPTPENPNPEPVLMTEYIDTDGDTILDSAEIDNDDDGILDVMEIEGLAHPDYVSMGDKSPRGADCNGDTMPDEVGTLDKPFDCDGDTVPDYIDIDSDNDTIEDGWESSSDSDNDGYFDRYEQDSDDDGLSDTIELGFTTHPVTSIEGSGMDFKNPDIDGDGLSDGDEPLCLVCRENENFCAERCVDVQTDAQHCGDCGIVCKQSEVCDAGVCVASAKTCAEGTTACWGECRDLATDVKNCSACGHVCDTGLSCLEGVCTLVCTDKTTCGNACVDVTSDPQHCGACGMVCGKSQKCIASQCVDVEVTCNTNEMLCWGECKNLASDSMHCGICGRVCGDGMSCSAGKCIPQGTKAVDARLVKDADEDGFDDNSEFIAATYLKRPVSEFICNTNKGVVTNEANGVTGAFNFYFQLPYEGVEQRDTLNFKPSVSKLDLMFNMDTTNSMGAEVNNLKERISSYIIPEVRKRVTNSAFGVSRFDDFPTRATVGSKYDYLKGNSVEDGYGRATSGDVPFELLGRPESDEATVSANVNKLALHHGGDFPESGYEALWQLVMGDDKTKPQVHWRQYGTYSVFSSGSLKYAEPSEDRWGGAHFRSASLPVVVHITDTTSHDSAENCPNDGEYKTSCKPYDPAYVENAHYSDRVHEAYQAKGARIISVYRQDGSQLQQLVDTSKATAATVPACAFMLDNTQWKCGENKCCTLSDNSGEPKPVDPVDGKCILSYGITSGDKLSTTLVDGVDALVKYATSDVAAVVRGEPMPGYAHDTSCFIKGVVAFDQTDDEGNPVKDMNDQIVTGYVAPPLEPEKLCNPTAMPTEFDNVGYLNGYTNFAMGTSSAEKPGAQLNFIVKAQNDKCAKSKEQAQVFQAYIDIIEPRTGMVFGTQQVSIVVPGVKAGQVN